MNEPSPISRSSHVYPERLLSFLLALLVVAVYVRVGGFDFVNYDDYWIIRDNPNLQNGLTWESFRWALTDSSYDWWHPLVWLSHMLDIELFGMNPGYHHVVNVVMHAINAVLLLGILRRMTGSLWASAFVAAVFALHPLRVESVAWVTERKDVLSTLCWILAMWAYWFYVRRQSIARYLWIVVALVLGLMAKPMLVTLPFALFLLDIWPLKRIGRGTLAKLLMEKVPLLVLAAGSSVLTMLGQKNVGGVVAMTEMPIASRVSNAMVSYVEYLENMFWPTGLTVFYPLPGEYPLSQVMISGIFLLFISILVIRAAREHPHLAVGWLWFLGTLFPVIGLVQVGDRALADRFTYVPHVGILVMMAWGVPILFRRTVNGPLALGALGGVCLTACVTLSWCQQQHWRNSVVLWQHAIRVTKHNDLAHNNLGCALRDLGDVNGAMEQFRIAARIDPRFELAAVNLGMGLYEQGKVEEAKDRFARALWAKPQYSETHYQLGLIFAAEHNVDLAIAYLAETVRLNPNHAEAHCRLGHLLAGKNQTRDAIAHYSEAVRIRPGYDTAHFNLAQALEKVGEREEALRHYRAAVQSNPDFAEAYNNMGMIYTKLGKASDAMTQFREALRVKPTHEKAHYNLGVVLASQGRWEEAIEYYSAAVRLKPRYSEARNNLGLALATIGQHDKAVVHFREALRQNPDYATAHYNLGLTLVAQGKWKESISEFGETIRLRPDLAEAHYQLAAALVSEGKHPAAVAACREALRLRPNWSTAQTKLAWVLATTSDPRLQKTSEAIQLATSACESTKNQDPECLDALAAAYAADGCFEPAVEAASKALSLASAGHREALAMEIGKRLALYREGRSYHESHTSP